MRSFFTGNFTAGAKLHLEKILVDIFPDCIFPFHCQIKSSRVLLSVESIIKSVTQGLFRIHSIAANLSIQLLHLYPPPLY